MDRMSCGDTVDRLPDWVADRLDGAEAGAVAAHVAGCAECAGEADVLRALLASRPAAPAGLAERIARAARADAGSQAPARRRRLAPAWALSAAAVLALAIGTTVLSDREQPAEPALGEAVEEDGGVWISDDALVAGAPVLEELSDDDLVALLEEMGG
jgi:anti-sigma factor RsiW